MDATFLLRQSGIIERTFWTQGPHAVYLTRANQLVGSHAALLAFRAAHADYAGWHSHHIVEEVHLRNLGVRERFGSRDDLPCVLLPAVAHTARAGSILRQEDRWYSKPDIMLGEYRRAYCLIGDYCGGGAMRIADELAEVSRQMFQYAWLL